VSAQASAPICVRPHARVPLTTLAIPLGLAGLAQVWSVATNALGAPYGLAQAFWAIAALAWAWTVAAHVLRGRRTEHRLRDQLTHLAQGPLAALLPISAMLLGAGLHQTWSTAGTVLVLLATLAAAAFGAWMTAFWMSGGMPLESVHGGYYLPISAAGLVGALAVGQTGIRWLAVSCFAIGCFFWLLITVVLFLRLVLRPAMPASLVPTLAIMIAPPAVAASAWLTISAGRPDVLFQGLTGITAFLTLVQVPLLARYRPLKFTHGFWSFTFPVASVVGLAITWLRIARPDGWRPTTVGLLICVTLLTLAIALKSLGLLRATSRRAAPSRWRIASRYRASRPP
jgi:tellurite resistance protein